MANDPKRKYLPWRKAFWLIFLAIVITLLACLIGLIISGAIHRGH